MKNDYRTPNRKPATFLQRINPLWWASDTEQDMTWPWWRWFIRNPFANFFAVVVGVAHCYRTVYYTKSPWSYAEDGGCNICITLVNGSWFPRPFISFRGKKWERSIGWKTSGCFALGDWRRANSPNAMARP